MGKITSIITFTGKLGNTVGSKGLRGRHLIRARQYEVKNPRSNAQNVQRMIFATAATSLSYLTEILNNSFEGKAFGQESLSYARKVNLDLLRNMNPTSAASIGAYLKKGDKFFAPNTYILSQGRLVSPSVEIIEGADYQFQIDGMTAADAQKTASQLFPNIAVGDQITYIGVAATGLSVTSGVDAEIYTDVRYCRFAFKDDTTPALVSEGGKYHLNPAAIDLVKAKGDWQKLEFESTEGYVNSMSFHDSYTDELVACAILVSNLENNQRSTTRLVVSRALDWKWRGAEAYPTYGNVAAEQYDFASDIYLNNSARRSAAGGDVQIRANVPMAFEAGQGHTMQLYDVSQYGQISELHFKLSYNGEAQPDSSNVIGVSPTDVIAGGSDMDYSITVDNQSMTGNNYNVNLIAAADTETTVITGGYGKFADGTAFTF